MSCPPSGAARRANRRRAALGRASLGTLVAISLAVVSCAPDFELDRYRFACEGDACRFEALPARCDQTVPEDLTTSAEHRDAFVFASLVDRSVASQRSRERAVRLAVTQANELGGVDGRTVGVILCTIERSATFDDLTRPQAAVDVASRLAADAGVRALVGPSASGDVGAVFAAVRDTDVLVISPSATSSALADIDVTSPTDERPGLLWRTAPPDSLQAAVIAADMDDRGVTEVAAVHATGAYGEGLTRELVRSFTGDVLLRPFANDAARDLAIAAAPGVASEVFFVSSVVGDAVAFLNAAGASSDYDGVGIFLPDSAANAELLDGTAAVGSARYAQVRGTRPATPSGFVYDAFVTSYEAAFDDDPDDSSFVAHAYDAAWMVIYAHAWAHFNEDGVSGTHLARGFRKLSDGRAFEVRPGDFQGIVQAFREQSGVDIAGSSGSLDYDLAIEETTGPIEVWRINANGAFEVIRVVEP